MSGPGVPGLNPDRLAALVRESVRRCRLDLSGAVVLTEAATGAYAVTPIIAAAAGAQHVYAVTRSTRYGTVEEVTDLTRAIASAAQVPDVIEVIEATTPQVVAAADIVTNSGHVRPIDAGMVEMMKPGAVVPLMYEDWEFRGHDLDLAACRRRGIRVTGTNERHPDVDVFSFLGIMAVKLLLDSGVAVYRSRVGLLCGNPFEPFIVAGLRSAGATVEVAGSAAELLGEAFDAVLVARTPGPGPSVPADELDTIARRWPGAVLAVYWGDVDRGAAARAGLRTWPAVAPAAGHMGILPSGVGPEPIVRLQSGSLKAAEALLRHADDPTHPDHAFGQPL